MKDIDELINLVFTMNRLTKEGLEGEKGTPSYIQLQALSFISKRKRPIKKDIAKHLKITPPSATFLINNLIKSKFINTLSNDKDKRETYLIISEKGKKELKKGFAKAEKYLHEKLAFLSTKERKSFILILKKISLLLTTD